MVTPAAAPTLHVNPSIGQDQGSGSANDPFKTLHHALSQATPGTIIQLAPGLYNQTSGEVFPLVVSAGIAVVGQATNQGVSVHFVGSGVYDHGTLGSLKIAIRLEEGAQLRGVSVSNTALNGTGIWIDQVAATITDCTIHGCGREGILLTGTANVLISHSLFRQNQTSGLTLLHHSKGEIRHNQFEAMGVGLAMTGNSAPLVLENRMINNQIGMAIAAQSQPILRHNQIEINQGHGLLLDDQAQPDLGQPQSPGHNTFQNNGGQDLYNRTSQAIVSVHNLLNPTRVQGAVSFQASQLSPAWLPPQERNPVGEVPEQLLPLPVSPIPVQSPFPDVGNHWAATFITALSDRQLIRGFPDGNFRPDARLTRAEYAALLATTFKLSARRNSVNFMDVSPDFWGAEAIGTTSRMGFLSGFPDRSFRPQQFLTRIQALVALVSGLDLQGGTPQTLDFYRDRAEIPSYATTAAVAATQHRLVVNHPDPDLLHPQQPITRGEVSAFVYQALVAQGRAPLINLPQVVNASLRGSTFTDLQNHWTQGFIQPLTRQQFLSGFPDGQFKPERIVSRAEYAALIAKVFNPAPRKPTPTFEDIAPDFWAREAIITTIRGGFLAGSEGMVFRPQEPVRRFQVLLSLASGLGLRPGDPAWLQQFEDGDQLPTYAHKAVAATLAQGLIVNYPKGDQLRPKHSAMRGEVAAMLYQGLVYQGRMAALNSPYVITLKSEEP
jgi:hypothetical protein